MPIDDDDASYLAQMIAANTEDRRPSNYPVMPPDLRDSVGERVLLNMPKGNRYGAEQELMLDNALASADLAGDPEMRGRLPEPVGQKLVSAMRTGLRPDLERMSNRPNALQMRMMRLRV